MSDEDFFHSGGAANPVPPPAPPPRQRSSVASRRSKPPPPPPPRGSRSSAAASSTAATASAPPVASSGTAGGAVPTFYGRTHPVDKGARISADMSGGPAAAAPAAPAPAPAAPSQSDLDWFGSSAAAAPPPSAPSAPPAAMNPYAGYGAPTQPTAQQQQTQPQFQQQTQPGAYAGYETAPLGGQQPAQQQQAGAGAGGFSGTIMSGPMGGAPAPVASSSGPSYASSASLADSDYENEPPLMEELGINLEHIGTKSRSVIWPIGKYTSAHIDAKIMEDADLVGPLAFGLLLGGELLLSGKIHFGYIYGFGLFGTLAMALVLNLMSPVDAISVWTVISVLGYALLPVNALAGINVLYRVQNMGAVGVFLGVLTIAWCTVASTRLFERGCGLRDQRYLVAYPGMLLYSAFVMITIF